MPQLDLGNTDVANPPADRRGWRFNSGTGKWEDNQNVAMLDVVQTWTDDQTFSGADIKIGGNELQTSGFKYTEGSVIGTTMPSISPVSSGASHLGLYPLSGNAVTLNLVRTADITTNWEALRIGSDISVANEFAFQITKSGTGTLRPFNFYMFATKLFSMDTANTVTFYKNLIMSGADINIAGNKLKTSSFDISEKSALGVNSISINPPSSGASYLVLHPATGNAAIFSLIRTTDITTNYETLRFGSDIQVSNEFAFQITKSGTGTLRPFNFYMFDTKLFSMDAANTVTFYKNLIMSGADINMGANSLTNIKDLDFDAGGSDDAHITSSATGLELAVAAVDAIKMKVGTNEVLSIEDAKVLPNANDQVVLGAVGNRFKEVHCDTIDVNTKLDMNTTDIIRIKESQFTNFPGNVNVGSIQAIDDITDRLQIKLESNMDFEIRAVNDKVIQYDASATQWTMQKPWQFDERMLMKEQSVAPPTPPSGTIVLYAVDNAGTQELKVKFDNGTVKTIANSS